MRWEHIFPENLEIIIWGAGTKGRNWLNFLRTMNRTVKCFFDMKKEGEIDGIPIVFPNSNMDSHSILLISPKDDIDNIISEAHKLGYYNLKVGEILYNLPQKNPKSVKQKVEKLFSDGVSYLDLCGIKNNTDKASLLEEDYDNLPRLAHDYLRHYDILFAELRWKKINLLEFGCAKGNSLRMWKEYFPNAEIYGVDLNQEAVRYESERIHIILGDATKEETYQSVKENLGTEYPSIIIDDASHAWGDQRTSFELFWDMLKPGGFYVAEDLECGTLGAYPQYPPHILDAQPFYDYILDRCKILRWAPEFEYLYKNSYQFWHLPERIRRIEMEIDECLLIHGAVIIKKKD